MMKTYRLLVLVPALLLCIATCAGAEIAAQSFSVSPYTGGYSFLGKENLDTAPVFGVRAGYNITTHFGIEAVVDYTNSDGRSSYGFDIHNYNWHLDMLYHFMPVWRLIPYAAVGYGWQDRKLPHDNSTTRTGLNYGIGWKYFINPALALRGDFRHLILNHRDETFHNVEYTIGVDFLFGGKTATAKEPATAPAPAKETAPAPAAVPAPPTAPAAPPPAPTPLH